VLTVGRVSAASAHPPEALWAQLVDAAAWPRWAEGTAWVVFEGPPVPGTYATIKPLRGRQTAYRIAAAVAPRLFVLELTFGPLARLQLTWTIAPVAGGSTVEATVEAGGPLAGLLVRRIAERVATALPANLERLAAAVVTKKDAADMRPRG